MTTNLIVDLSNLVHAAKWSTMKDSGFSEGLIMHSVLTSILYSAKEFNVDGILIACDGANNFRYKIYPEYKGNRESDEYTLRLRAVLVELGEFFNTCTSIPAIRVNGAEADDVIAIIAQNAINKMIILSTDKDFVQLCNDKVRLYAPTLQLERTSEDPNYDLFLKCIRGDKGDNIFSAYPRVRETKLKEAWNNSLDMINLMETVLPDGKIVKDLYEFNKSLIDLSKQPTEIKDDVFAAINNIEKSSNKYDYMKTIKFFGKWDMKNMADETQKNSLFFKKKFVL